MSSAQFLRWSGSFAFVLATHVGVAALALGWLDPAERAMAAENPAAIMLELAPLTAVPEPVEETPPGPDLSEVVPEPEPPPPVDIPPMPAAMLPAPELRPPEEVRRPSEQVEKKTERALPSRRTAPQAVPQAAPIASALAADVTPLPQSAALPTWKGMLLRHLERHKRYPPEAQRARHEGVTYVRFTMSRDGRVLFATVVRPTGISSLDQEGLELLRRAEPLPSLPADQPGETLALVVPIQFHMRR